MNAKLPIRPNTPDEFRTSLSNAKRARLIKDATAPPSPNNGAVERFALRSGEMYRISYASGGTQQRRVSRSIALFGGLSDRRSWGGDTVPCLDFALPHGRTLSLLSDQLVDARAAALNERGQWVLSDDDALGRSRRPGRRVVGLRSQPSS